MSLTTFILKITVMGGDMQSIGQSSSAEMNIVGILDWEACYLLTWWYFAAHYQYLSFLHHLESVIIASQNKKEWFLLWDDFLLNTKVHHSFSCTYLQKFIGAELSVILSGIASSYLKKCEQWQWPLHEVVEYRRRKQKLRLHPFTPAISGARKIIFSLFVVSASASVQLLSFMFSKIKYILDYFA